MRRRQQVGVRELRQNLSVYLRRVARGKSYEVTARGQPVALLTPLPERATVLDRLAAEGRLVRGRGHLADLGPAPRLELERPLSEHLDDVRRDVAS